MREMNEKKVSKSFDLFGVNSIRCVVHPSVVLTVLDAYVRREESQSFVLGTLLGVITEGNIIEITDCFVDPHSHTDEGIQIIKDQHELMYELKQKVHPKHIVVGWFFTGPKMYDVTCAVHIWFKNVYEVSKFTPQPPLNDPIQLLIDTSLKNHTLAIKAYVQVPLPIVNEAVFQFHEVPLEIFNSPADRIGISMLIKSNFGQKNNKNDEIYVKDGIQSALIKLKTLLDKCNEYVEGVLNETEQTDVEIGRYLSKALDINSISDPEQFEQMTQTTLQDTLMVSQLASLAQINFELAERINTSFF